MTEFSKTGVDIPALSRFDKFVRVFLEQDGNNPLHGAVLAITSGDRLVFARGYTRDKPTDGIMPPASLYRIASATKPITGIAIHQLLEAPGSPLKLTDWADPIVNLKQPSGAPFKQDPQPQPNAPSQKGNYFHEVTIQQLLTHRTGLLDGLGTADVKVAQAYQMGMPFKLPVDRYQVASWGIAQGQAYWPGSARSYSNLDYGVLGFVIEKKTGRGYRSAVQHTVFGPVGVSRARGARSRESERAPGETGYHLVPPDGVLVDEAPSVLETAQPTVPRQYGGENFENKISYGGWVFSAVDYARVLASFASTHPLVAATPASLLFWWNSPKKSTTGVEIYRHGAVLPGSAGVVGLRKDGFSVSFFFNTTKGGTNYVFEFEGHPYNVNTDSGHETVLHKIIDEMDAASWPAHDLFPLHGVPANVTDVIAAKDGNLLLAVRGPDEGLHLVERKDGAWGRWVGEGGHLATPPRLASWGSGHHDVFALGPDRALWHRERLPDGSASAWKSLGGDLQSEPCAVSWKPKRVDVFAVGKDHDLRHFWRDENTGWGGEESLRGFLTTPPAAVSRGPGSLDVFALGEKYSLIHCWHDPVNGWSAWEDKGGDLRSYPEVVSWGEKRLDVFALGPNRSLMHLAHDPQGGWGTWTDLGGDLRCSPTVTSWGPNRIDVFGVTAAQELIHIFYTAQGWSKWQPLGGVLSSRPKAVSWGVGHIEVLAAGRDQTVLHLSSVSATHWAPWKSVGGEVG